jgi:hypothetical protein
MALTEDQCRTTIDRSFFSEQKRSVQTGNRNRDEFNRQEHTAHDGFWGGRKEDEIHAEKLGCLSRWSFPGRKEHGQNQDHDHSVEHREIELVWCRVSMALRTRRALR